MPLPYRTLTPFERRLGLAGGAGLGRPPGLGPLSPTEIQPQTQGFPQPSLEEFEAGQVRKQAEPAPGLLAPIAGVTFSSLQKILEILGAGEFAVSGLLENTIKAMKGEGQLDPFGSFWRGFRSGFTGEDEYQKTFSDVLTAFGWRPQEGSAESWAKFAAGLVGGVFLDPAFYIWPGALGAKIHGRTVREISEEVAKGAAKKVGVNYSLPGAVARRGLNINPEGRKALKGLERWARADIGKEAAGRITLGAAEDALKLSPAQRLLAGVTAERDLARVTLPVAHMGITGKEALAMKGKRLVERVLKGLKGYDYRPTLKEMEEFALSGYQKLLDEGGLRFFGKRLFAARAAHYGPKTAETAGSFLSQLVRNGVPWHHAVAATVVDSKAMRALAQNPVSQGLKELFTKHFSRFGGLGSGEKAFLKYLDNAGPNGIAEAEALVGNLATVRKVAQGVDALGRPAVSTSGRAITHSEGRFLTRLLWRARHYGVEDAAKLKEWILKDEKVIGWAQRLGLAGRMSDELAEGLADTAVRIQRHFGEMHDALKPFSKGDPFLDAYFPRMFKMNNKRWRDLERRLEKDPASVVADPWREPQKYLDDFDDVVKSVKAGRSDFPGEPRDDLIAILTARTGAVLGQAKYADALDQLAYHFGKYPHLQKKVDQLLRDPEFIGHYSRAAEIIARGASHDLAAGIPAIQAKEVDRALLAIGKTTKRPEWMEQNAKNLMASFDGLRNLTTKQRDSILKRVDALIRDRSSVELTPDGEQVLGVLKGWRGKFEEKLNEKLAGQTFNQAVRGLREVAQEVAPELPIAANVNQVRQATRTLRGEVTSWAELQGPALEQTAANFFGRHAAAIGPDEAPRLASDVHWAQTRVTTAQTLRKRAEDAYRAVVAPRNLGAVKHVPEGAINALTEPVEAFHREVGRHLTEVMAERQFLFTSRVSQWSPLDRARFELAETELKTLLDLKLSAPSESFVRRLRSETDSLKAIVRDLEETTTLARKAGAGRHLSTIIHKVAPHRHYSDLTPRQRETIKQLLTPTATANRAAVRFLTPSHSEVKSLVGAGRFTLKSPISGEVMDAAELVGGDVNLARGLLGAKNPTDPSALGGLKRMIDSATQVFKEAVTNRLAPFLPITRPAFHVRNTVDLLFRVGYGYGVGAYLDPEVWRMAWNTVSGKRAAMVVDGIEFSSDMGREMMQDLGVWPREIQKLSGGRRVDLHAAFNAAMEKKYPAMVDGVTKAVEGLSDSKLGLLGPLKAGTSIEQFFASMAFYHGLKQGVPAHQIVEDLGQFLFYYGNLTGTERSLMRTIFPFWGFQRQAIGLIGWSAVKRPWAFGTIRRARDLAAPTKEEEALIPDWIKEYPFVKVGSDGKKLTVASFRNVFTLDVAIDLLPSSWRDLASQANPILTTPFELIMGRDIYFGRDIPARRAVYNELQNPALRDSPLGKWLNAEKVTMDGKDYVKVDGGKYQALRRLWFSRFYREMDDITDVIDGRSGVGTAAGLLMGFKTKELDLEREQLWLERDAKKAYEEYRHALRIGDSTAARRILREMRIR